MGVPAIGFDLYVREDKFVLGYARLMELAQKLSPQPGPQTPHSVKKGDMTSLHQLLFWFIIKNVIPRGQGRNLRRNLTDAMDQCFVDLMNRGEQINLPSIMIRQIARIANTTRDHVLGYGFLLTLIFENFGLELQKKVRVQVINEIGSSTLMGCGFSLAKGEHSASEQGPRSTFPLFLVAVPVGLPLKHSFRTKLG